MEERIYQLPEVLRVLRWEPGLQLFVQTASAAHQAAPVGAHLLPGRVRDVDPVVSDVVEGFFLAWRGPWNRRIYWSEPVE